MMDALERFKRGRSYSTEMNDEQCTLTNFGEKKLKAMFKGGDCLAVRTECLNDNKSIMEELIDAAKCAASRR